MTFGKFLIPSAVAVGLAGIAFAQGPTEDKVIVDLPYSITIQNKTLQPGEYTIRQMPSSGERHTLLISSNGGMKFETSAITVPTLSNRTPNDTTVVLHHFGPDYYFDKIWVQGKNYGYEFPLPASVKARERERAQSVTVAANYEAAAPVVAEQRQETTQMAQTTPPPAQETPAAPETPQAAPAPAPEAPAQAAPAPAPEAPQVAQAPAPVEQAPARMPHTDANWLAMLLSGGLLSGAGLMFRRSS